MEVGMKVQFIETGHGDDLVVLSRRDYDALLARAGDQDAEDRMTLLIAAEVRGGARLQPPSQSSSSGLSRGPSVPHTPAVEDK
jgi:hypothetical protein